MRTAQSRVLIAAFAALAPATGALAQSIQLEQIAFVERVSHDGGDRSTHRETAALDVRQPARHADAAARAQARRANGPR